MGWTVYLKLVPSMAGGQQFVVAGIKEAGCEWPQSAVANLQLACTCCCCGVDLCFVFFRLDGVRVPVGASKTLHVLCPATEVAAASPDLVW